MQLLQWWQLCYSITAEIFWEKGNNRKVNNNIYIYRFINQIEKKKGFQFEYICEKKKYLIIFLKKIRRNKIIPLNIQASWIRLFYTTKNRLSTNSKSFYCSFMSFTFNIQPWRLNTSLSSLHLTGQLWKIKN